MSMVILYQIHRSISRSSVYCRHRLLNVSNSPGCGCGPAHIAINISFPAFLFAKDLQHQSLFKIERSKNVNIIQYDAQIGSNGKLLKKEPVIGYWIRLAEQGQIQELSWIQSTFAFGFKAKYNQTNDTATVDMVADIGQPITVQSVKGKYIATVDLDGIPSQLVKIFIKAHRKGIRATVEHVEIFGKDLKSGEETYARIIP